MPKGIGQHPPIPSDAVNSLQMVKETGATLRQIQWWDEHGYVIPAFGHRKHSRLYSSQQITIVRKMVALRNAGVCLSNANRCAVVGAWTKIIIVDKPILVGKVLLVPSSTGTTHRKKRPRPITQEELDLLDQIALQDPEVARGR